MAVTTTIAATYSGLLTVTETYTGGDMGTGSTALQFSGYNTTVSMVPTIRAGGTITLSAGAATIDLTALTSLGTNGATANGNGLKLLAWKFIAPSGNANPITVKFGAANAYLLGGAAWTWILSPGQEIMGYGNAATPTIDGTHKTIDLAGTASQTLNVEFVMG